MLILGKASSTVLTKVASSHCAKYIHCCSIFTGIVEAFGNKYSFVCVKPHLEPNLSLNTPFVIKWQVQMEQFPKMANSVYIQKYLLSFCVFFISKRNYIYFFIPLSHYLVQINGHTYVRQKRWSKKQFQISCFWLDNWHQKELKLQCSFLSMAFRNLCDWEQS